MNNPAEDDETVWDIFKAMKVIRQKSGYKRRKRAMEEFDEVKNVAAQFNLTLMQHTDTHYSLRSLKGWILNIYPGNGRLYRDEHSPKMPYLKLPEQWTLLDVVEQAARAEQKERDQNSEIVRDELQNG